jgi:hypothetical protein
MAGRLTRRELIAGSGALAAAALAYAGLRSTPGGGPAPPPPAPTAIPTPAATLTPTPEPEPAGLRKLIDIGPGGVISPGSAQDYRFHSNPSYFADTQTRWIRMWADWPSLQPDGAYAIDDPKSPGYKNLLALDEQIGRACADGLSVVLMAYRYPAWANGTAAVAAAPASDAEVSFQYWDRMSRPAWMRYLGGGRRPLVYDPPRAGLAYRIPDEGHGPQSAWARFFEFLYARYHLGRRASGRYVRAFELVNEPNLQLWPQYAPPIAGGDPFAPTAPTASRAVADMVITAQQVSARYDHSTLMLAPSLSDLAIASGRRQVAFDQFAARVLQQLEFSGYRPHERQAWSHHNYSDVEYRTGAARTKALIGLLGGRFGGFYVTEGGARVSRMAKLYPLEDPRVAQARCVQEAWAAHAGAGVSMLAQYLLYDDVRFDSGLIEPFPSTAPRPAYGVWKTLV